MNTQRLDALLSSLCKLRRARARCGNSVGVKSVTQDRLRHGLRSVGALALAASVGLVFSTLPAAAIDDIVCKANDVCRIAKTRLPLRVLPRVSSSIYEKMDTASPVVESDVPAFNPLFVMERVDVNYDDPENATGWFKVGRSKSKAIGYMQASDVLEWKSAMIVSYTHRGVGEAQRRPVLMFKDRSPLEDLLDKDNLSEVAASYYDRLAKNDPPEGVWSREPDTWVDISKKFYLLPVIEAHDLSGDFGIDARILRVAAAVPGKRAKKSDHCVAGTADYTKCIEAKGKVTDDKLRINVVYVMDTTGSMQPYIEAVVRAMRNSARYFQTVAGSSDRLRFGFVGYRDALASDGKNEYVAKNFTPNLVDHKEFVNVVTSQVRANAGGDIAEEVYAGFLKGLQSNWDTGDDETNKPVKLIVVIGDASAHEPSHKFSTTGKSYLELRRLASEQNIYVATIYIKNSRQSSDWPKGTEQFRALGENPGESVAFWAVGEEPNEIENKLSEATALMVERIKKIKADRGAKGTPSASGGGKAGDGAVDIAFKAALVEFVGRATEPPKDITAWVVDKDLTNLSRSAFNVHVLVTRSNLDELTQNLEKIVEAYTVDDVSNEGFFKVLQSLATISALDGNLLSKATVLAKTSLMPRWIDALPYKSDLMSLSFQQFEEFTPDQRADQAEKLRSLIRLYRDILERPESWVKLNDQTGRDDEVYPLRLDNLP